MTTTTTETQPQVDHCTSARSLLAGAYERAATVRNGNAFTTVNEFTDQHPPTRPELFREAASWCRHNGEFAGDVLLAEEDKGAFLAGLVAVLTDKPLACARWYPYGLQDKGGIKVPMTCEYREGDLYLNGVKPGDRLILVEDTISSGGTILALVDAVRLAGARVVEAFAVVEKIDQGGVRRVFEATGLLVKTGLGIRVEPATGQVIVVYDRIHSHSTHEGDS